MWQVEDILRAHHCSIDELRTNYLARFDVSEDQRAALDEWYENLLYHDARRRSDPTWTLTD